MADQVVHTDSVRAAFIAIADSVLCHPFYVASDVKSDAIARIETKMRDKFSGLSRDRYFCARQRAAQKPAHRLILYTPDDAKHEGFFCLLSSAKDDSGELWRDARERHQRITLYDYELYRYTVKGLDRPRWSWRMTAKRFDKLKTVLEDAVKKRQDKLLNEIVMSSQKWPGFHGVREQQHELERLVQGLFIRVRSTDPPDWPRIPYVTRRVYQRAEKASESA